ncbi:MAG: undecaprenyl-diphosphate phosphatase [Candidatus Falkowbacteria bacterium]
MTIIQSFIMGLVEGLTEFLPISSTAHLIFTGELLRIPTSDFLKSFEISIQLGAILSVVILYWSRVWNNLNIIWKLVAAFIPTSIIGLIFYKLVKGYLMENNLVIAISLIAGGIIIILFENWYAKKNIAEVATDADLNAITYKQAMILGVVQALAIVPGVSRAGATIIGGLAQGIKRKTIVEFSFLLAIPTMLAATALDIYKNPTIFTGNQLTLWVIGFVTSFVTAIIGVKFLIKYVQKNDFKAFGWYRIVLGLIVLGIILL